MAQGLPASRSTRRCSPSLLLCTVTRCWRSCHRFLCPDPEASCPHRFSPRVGTHGSRQSDAEDARITTKLEARAKKMEKLERELTKVRVSVGTLGLRISLARCDCPVPATPARPSRSEGLPVLCGPRFKRSGGEARMSTRESCSRSLNRAIVPSSEWLIWCVIVRRAKQRHPAISINRLIAHTDGVTLTKARSVLRIITAPVQVKEALVGSPTASPERVARSEPHRGHRQAPRAAQRGADSPRRNRVRFAAD